MQHKTEYIMKKTSFLGIGFLFLAVLFGCGKKETPMQSTAPTAFPVSFGYLSEQEDGGYAIRVTYNDIPVGYPVSRLDKELKPVAEEQTKGFLDNEYKVVEITPIEKNWRHDPEGGLAMVLRGIGRTFSWIPEQTLTREYWVELERIDAKCSGVCKPL